MFQAKAQTDDAHGIRLQSKMVYATLENANTIGRSSQQARDLHVIIASLPAFWRDAL